jgi:hypothetical protein
MCLTVVGFLPFFSPVFRIWLISISSFSACCLPINSILVPTLTTPTTQPLPSQNAATPRVGQERVADAEKAAVSAVNGTPKQKAQAQQEILGTGAK